MVKFYLFICYVNLIMKSKEFNSLLLVEVRWRNPLKATVGYDFVVVFSPSINAISGLWQDLKPLFTQEFISELFH